MCVKAVQNNYSFEVSLVIDEDGFVHDLFYVAKFIFIFNDGTIFFMDANFKIVPQIDGAFQFLLVMCEKYGNVIKYVI